MRYPEAICPETIRVKGQKGGFMKKDITKKRLEDHNDVFADIFNVLLFDGEEVLLEEYLVPMPTEGFSRMHGGTLRQGNRDVRKADKRDGCYRLIFGGENQEGIDNTMPQRLMGYDFASYEEQIKNLVSKNTNAGKPAVIKRIHDNQKLAPVITILLYWGADEWSTPLTLHDMLKFPFELEEKIKPFVADYPMNLIQISSLPDQVRRRFKSDFRLLAEFVFCKNDALKLMLLSQDNTKKLHHPEELLDALSAVSKDIRYENMKKQISQRAEKEDVTMCVLADMLENKGIEQGIKRGISALIQDNLEDGKMEPQILDKLVKHFSLSRERAKEYFNTFTGTP